MRASGPAPKCRPWPTGVCSLLRLELQTVAWEDNSGSIPIYSISCVQERSVDKMSPPFYGINRMKKAQFLCKHRVNIAIIPQMDMLGSVDLMFPS